ncbi:MAG TPA: 50S ribosomal protein L21 [Candidatus Cybelea sp.]|nr:50S ribosomal protein L21 [Candidatus Cybelea sp.]
MYAVIKTGGKQYKVASGDVITVERLGGEAGSVVAIDQVLAIGGDGALKLGKPLLEGAAVAATIVEQTRGDKIIVFKKKRRQNYRRKNGHRQDLTVLRIGGIAASGGSDAALKATASETKAGKSKADKPAKKPRAKKKAAASEESE